jgi:anaerobic magnesium-protoporphyrin IX monomethyl ester cyclase
MMPMPHAILLQPPPGDLTGPFAGLPYLKAYAQQRGFDVRIHDLGLEAFFFLAQTDRVLEMVSLADAMRKRQEKKGVLEPIELRWYGLLLMAKGFGVDPDILAEAVEVLQDKDQFYDYEQYKLACKVIDAFYRMLRALHYPTMVTPSGYPSVHDLKTIDKIGLHREGMVNPFVEFYEHDLFPQIAEDPPAVIGISMVYASQTTQALVLGMMLKKRFPDIHVTFGGSYLSQWAMVMEDAQVADLLVHGDSIVCGEGEGPFADLLERVVNGQSLNGLPNVIYGDYDAGIIHRYESLVSTDLATLPPPDFSDLYLDDYLVPEPILPYTLSRGCYWQKCAFCENRAGDAPPRPYQSVPADKAVSELVAMSEDYDAHHFHMCVDVVDPDDLSSFSKRLVETKTQILWNTNLRVEDAFNADFCMQLRGAGLNSVAIGVESGCQQTLDAMQKGTDIVKVGLVLRNFYNAGVATQVIGFFGYPAESERKARQTVAFLYEHSDVISNFDFGLLMIRPGAAIHDNPETFGVALVSYHQAPMMTPEPMWKSANRIPLAGLDRLYEQIGQLEQGHYLMSDAPFVGSLCSNHSFLYFKNGKDVLKHLRSMENFEHQTLHHIFGMNQGHQSVAPMKPKIPTLVLPCELYQSPYKHERRHFSTQVGNRGLTAGPGWVYLLDPINIPLRVGPDEQQVLQRINGERTIEAVLGDQSSGESSMLLTRLVLTGVLSLSDNAGESPP